MEDDIVVYKYEYGKDTLVFNVCCMGHREQSRFLQMYQNAVKNGVDAVEFVKAWNSYAEDMVDHVFWHVEEKQKKFVERGK